MRRGISRELLLVFPAFLLLVVAIRWDAVLLPPFWDELGFYFQYAYTLFEGGFRLGHRWLPEIFFQHTPLSMAAIAAVAKVAGWKLGAIRAVSFLAGAAYLSGTYALARLFAGPRVAACAAAALLFSPVALSETGMAQPDLPMAAFAAWALWCLAREQEAESWRKFLAASLLFACGTMTNGTLWALAPAFALMAWRRGRRPGFGAILAFFAPAALGSVAWLAYFHRIEPAWIPFHAEPEIGNVAGHGIAYVAHRLAHRIIQIFVWDGRWALTAALVVSAASRRFRPRAQGARAISTTQLGLVAVLVLETAFLSVAGATAQRYFMVALPALFALGAGEMERLAPRLAPWILLLLCGVGYQSWKEPADRFASVEYRSAYRDQVHLIERVAAELRAEPVARLYARWPFTDALTKPFLGYVERAIPLVSVDHPEGSWTPDATASAALVFLDEGPDTPPEVARRIADLQDGIFRGDCGKISEGEVSGTICRTR